jgi:Ca-activated chloride channel homolog
VPGSAHLVLPPTRDTAVVATMAAEISPSIMPRPGDDLVGALKLATQTLGDAGGSIVVVADSVAADESILVELRRSNRLPIHFLAVARPDTPELDAIRRAATVLGADVTVMTPDLSDVQLLVRSTAKAPVAVNVAGAGTRWAEAGWWLVPLIALISLVGFRRVESGTPWKATS